MPRMLLVSFLSTSMGYLMLIPQTPDMLNSHLARSNQSVYMLSMSYPPLATFGQTTVSLYVDNLSS